MYIIGISGVARTGKDSFADFLMSLSDRKMSKKSFAYEVKKDLDPFLIEKLGISAFTEDELEKEIIRPILICWGTDIIRKKVDEDYWIKKIAPIIENNRKNDIITVIPDVRFDNERRYIQSVGKVIFLKREDKYPIGWIEKETMSLESKCDFVFSWPNLTNFKEKGSSYVKSFLKDKKIW